MPLETGTFISDLVATNPPNTDQKAQGAAHLRLTKATLKATFPAITGAVTPTHTELNFVAGVTSSVQAQLAAEITARTNADNAEITARTNADALKANLASPTLTGTPTAPTAAAATNTTQVSTTAYADAAVLVEANRAVAAEATKAALNSPAFTGAPTAPTAAVGTGTTQLATTAFVAATAFLTALPGQAGNAGKFVTTDGTNASFVAAVSSVNGATGAVVLKTLNGASLTGAGNIALDSSIQYSGRTLNTALAAADKGFLIDITIGAGNFTLAFAAAATLGSGWFVYLRNSGLAVLTLDPNGAETIDGATTKVMHPGQLLILQCDGVALRTLAVQGEGNHAVVVHTGNGYGSTNIKIRRFTTALTNVGTAITYADSATLGATFTINEAGLYAIQFEEFANSGTAFGISVNSPELSFSITDIAIAGRISMSTVTSNSTSVQVFAVARLTANDVIRAHGSFAAIDASNRTYFSIRKVGS